jgi:hypothetical protein
MQLSGHGLQIGPRNPEAVSGGVLARFPEWVCLVWRPPAGTPFFYGATRLRALTRVRSTSPPLSLLGGVRAVCPVKRIELRHVLVGEREVEHLAVLLDSLAVGRLGNHGYVAL